MRTSFFVLSLVLAAAPVQAGSKLKKVKRVVLCAVSGGQEASVQWKKETALVDVKMALDAAAAELERQLAGAGIEIVPLAEAEAAAKKLRAGKLDAAKGKLAASEDAMAQGAGAAENSGFAAAMTAAMNNPSMTPEMREQMKKHFAASKGQGGASVKSRAAAQNADAMDAAQKGLAMEAARLGSLSTGNTLTLCPGRSIDQLDRGGESGEKFTFRDGLGADGWLSVEARFGEVVTSDTGNWAASAASAIKYTFSNYVPRWVFEASIHDKKGKRIWSNRKPIRGEMLKIGGTPASAKKAIEADVPNIVGKVVEELTD